VSAAAGRHRSTPGPLLTLPVAPDGEEKRLYVWRSLPLLTICVTTGFTFAAISQAGFMSVTGYWEFLPFVLLTVGAFGLSMPLSFLGPGFDYKAHEDKVAAWRPRQMPSVDIFLPVCGEPPELLANTWHYVAGLVRAYPGPATAWVLDDGADPRARALASEAGLRYVVRLDRGKDKKSGNLRSAFSWTSGEFFVVLDADFAPRPDFLAETLPYFDDSRVAIVQTPQFFRTSAAQTWVERAAGAVQEVFYRAIQTSRNRLGASICVGTCAVYRRASLEDQGGTTLIAYAEDVHTGLDVRREGWDLQYVPVVLTAGTCPSTLDAFARQQYRWCTGSTSTVLTSRLWSVPMTHRARMTYVSGFCYYASTAAAVFAVPLIPIALLAFHPAFIKPLNSVPILIAMFAGLGLFPLWHYSDYRLRDVLPLSVARGWAHALAIWDYLRGRTMAWQPTGSGVSTVRRMWWGIRIWNGGACAVWLGLLAWRVTQYGAAPFAVVGVMGLINAAVTLRLLFPGREVQG
jgi:cellulose synthase (UDP-forming)